MFGHTYSKSMDQPGKVAKFAPDNLVSRDGFGIPVPRRLLISILGLVLVLTYGIPPEFCNGVHLFL